MTALKVPHGIYPLPIYFVNTIIYLGSSRKLLGLTFQGETRDADGMIWADVKIKGLTNDVCLRPLSPFLILYLNLSNHSSSGMSGASQGTSRKQIFYLYIRQGLNSPYLLLISILARPHFYIGNQFSIGITGQNFDPADLVEPAKLTQFIRAETGRTELEFGRFTSLTYFK